MNDYFVYPNFGVELYANIVSIWGVMAALTISIFLIIKKLNPALAMFLGVFVGAIVGQIGNELASTTGIPEALNILTLGGRQAVGINLRIIAGGVLAGVLIETGSAESIARNIVSKLGERRVLLAIALSSMLVIAAGVFFPVAMMVLAPIAILVSYRAGVSRFAAILALSGGGKAGNIISPNPNTLAAADAFNVPLSQVMIGGIIPGAVALIVTIILCNMVKKKGTFISKEDLDDICSDDASLPSLGKALVAPIVSIGLLMLNPIGDIADIAFINSYNLPMDPFFVLPLGGFIGLFVMGKAKRFIDIATKGVLRMAPIVLMLFGAGAMGGLISASSVPDMLQSFMYTVGVPIGHLAYISSGIFAPMAGSNAAGVIIGGNFASDIVSTGVPALAGAVMMHAGGGFIDVVPHGNIFLTTQQGMKATIKERIKIIPCEALIGGMMLLTAILLWHFGFWG